VTKPFRTWPSTHPFSDKASPYPLLCIRRMTDLGWFFTFGGSRMQCQINCIIKLSIIRGRTSINRPSNSRALHIHIQKRHTPGRIGSFPKLNIKPCYMTLTWRCWWINHALVSHNMGDQQRNKLALQPMVNMWRRNWQECYIISRTTWNHGSLKLSAWQSTNNVKVGGLIFTHFWFPTSSSAVLSLERDTYLRPKYIWSSI
jgi:hypothetical protein